MAAAAPAGIAPKADPDPEPDELSPSERRFVWQQRVFVVLNNFCWAVQRPVRTFKTRSDFLLTFCAPSAHFLRIPCSILLRIPSVSG
jgi:hypothetical protein